jgi:nucleoid-associated protein YgaU
LKSPLDALHHLDRYLELVPTGTQAKDAKNLIKDYQNKLLVQLSKGTPTTQAEAVQLKNENQMLLEKIAILRAQKAATPIPTGGTASKPSEPQKKPIPPGSRTYTVKAGDTLAKISRQYYKTSARAQDIQDANFNQLNGTVKIKPGMELIIPK